VTVDAQPTHLTRLWSTVPLKRLCDLGLLAPRRSRGGIAVPRTPGTCVVADDLPVRSGAVIPSPAVPVVCAVTATHATGAAVERFYTTVEPIRERATEGWRVSTLTTKEKRSQMVSGTATTSPVSRRGVAEFRDGAVFCQLRPARPPRSFAFDRCGRPAWPGDLRRYQD
jgi:hypothetical protein